MVALKIEDITRVLGSSTRLRIIIELFKIPEGIHVRELARKFAMKPQSMSEHIKILEASGLIGYRKIGPVKIITLKNTKEVKAIKRFLEEMGLLC
jgi:DNA-binding transcriptional ArsR family regulator